MSDTDSADDLRSLLSKAHDDALSSTSSLAIEAGTRAASEPVESDLDPSGDVAAEARAQADRDRDEAGRFKKKEADAAAAEKAKADAKVEPKADAKDPKAEADKAAAEGQDKTVDADKQQDAKATGKEPPQHWPASDKAMFKLQPPEAQEFLLRRHKQMEAEFTKRNEAIVSLKRDYEPVQQLFQPYSDVLNKKGLSPATVIQRWASVETDLASGDPQRQLRIISGIVQGYGIDRGAVAQALGLTGHGAQGGQQQQRGADPSSDDPAAQLLAQLEQRIAQSFAPKLAKIDQWEQTQHQTQAAAQQREVSRVDNEIQTFKSAVDTGGNVLHPYFDEVEPAMVALAQSYQASGQPIPKLDDLYETAVWANPSTRATLLATQKAAQEAKAAEEARAKAASARRAGSSITGAPGSGQNTRSIRGEQSLREQLEEAAADLG